MLDLDKSFVFPLFCPERTFDWAWSSTFAHSVLLLLLINYSCFEHAFLGSTNKELVVENFHSSSLSPYRSSRHAYLVLNPRR